MEDFKQRAMAELARNRGLPFDDWEKVKLRNSMIAPRLMHRALLLGDDEYWYYGDKVFQYFVWESHRHIKGQMRATMNKPAKEGRTGLRMTYRAWWARFITVMHSALRRPSAVMKSMMRNKKVSTPPQNYADLVHELGGETIFLVSTTRQVKRGDQLLEDEGTHGDVVTTAQITKKVRSREGILLNGNLCPHMSHCHRWKRGGSMCGHEEAWRAKQGHY